jgi:hypothetical protein
MTTLSGIAPRPPTEVEALEASIERFAREGGIALWCIVPLLPQLKSYHWAAYARDARIPFPSPETIAAAIQLYRQRIDYIPTGQTIPPIASAPTIPAQAAR